MNKKYTITYRGEISTKTKAISPEEAFENILKNYDKTIWEFTEGSEPHIELIEIYDEEGKKVFPIY